MSIELKPLATGEIQVLEESWDGIDRRDRREVSRLTLTGARALLHELSSAIKAAEQVVENNRVRALQEKKKRLAELQREIAALQAEIGAPAE